MERTAVAAAVTGGTVLAVGSLLAFGLHVLPGKDLGPRSAAGTARTPAVFAPGAGWTPEPDDFRGATAVAGDWRLRVTGVRVDGDGVLADGRGSGVRAPRGAVYQVFTLLAVNRGAEPMRFAPAGATAASVDGRTFANDPEAERALSGAAAPLLDPGAAARTEVVFPTPPDARLYEVVVTVEYGAVFANLEARR
ncbi:DUF4352 domain-containing protein [Thermobifida cellulosilytica]|uniref:DUF4352 domain-containing protein n=1 Tax=Thermobifida cellulosilytica TB100 TaxID=665004 RepID=A0A147KIL1_THECS|nr:hypothetical protein [Thermobifida cellulosilytica]KUP97135.1 hypothetical protein AC529_08455 [Thermobifida cellulosilytica TB100]